MSRGKHTGLHVVLLRLLVGPHSVYGVVLIQSVHHCLVEGFMTEVEVNSLVQTPTVAIVGQV